MFELQGTINQGDDAEPINYAAVISSIGYPDKDTSEFPPITFIDKIPVGAYITYTLLTSTDNNRHLVYIRDFDAVGNFKLDLSSPFSLKHEDISPIQIGASGNPVFLLKYEGKLPTRLC